jgi:hypothetical protein
VIGGRELKIDLANMEFIIKWEIPNYVTKISIFVGVSRYLLKFIASFSVVVATLHSITTRGKSF